VHGTWGVKDGTHSAINLLFFVLFSYFPLLLLFDTSQNVQVYSSLDTGSLMCFLFTAKETGDEAIRSFPHFLV
jgi:hypothetical protein